MAQAVIHVNNGNSDFFLELLFSEVHRSPGLQAVAITLGFPSELEG